MTDPIADLLTRIRNAQRAGHETVNIPHSKLKASISKVLCEEGYVRSLQVVGEGVKKQLVLSLKYVGPDDPVIAGLKRVSSPGRRVYAGSEELDAVKPGMGIAILTTPKGVMTDKKAKAAAVGGEVLCQVW